MHRTRSGSLEHTQMKKRQTITLKADLRNKPRSRLKCGIDSGSVFIQAWCDIESMQNRCHRHESVVFGKITPRADAVKKTIHYLILYRDQSIATYRRPNPKTRSRGSRASLLISPFLSHRSGLKASGLGYSFGLWVMALAIVRQGGLCSNEANIYHTF